MRKLSEGLWSDIVRRGTTGEVREEDEVGNIKDIKWRDLGGNVLWADRDFEMGGQDMFSYEDMKNIKLPDGIHLPSYDDFYELVPSMWHKVIGDDENFIEFKDIYWDLKGMLVSGKYPKFKDRAGFFLASNKHQYNFEVRGLAIDRIDDIVSIAVSSQLCNDDDKIQIRLVKDK